MEILRSLAHIATEYSIFEENQVLTHEQLNSIASYLDDQSRLTRVNLLGVGIVCGLLVSVQSGTGVKVKVTRGVGITTDGDLLHFASDVVFDRFKLYDASQPKYAPFYTGETMSTVYELIPKDTSDERAQPLSDFESQTESTLNAMVAVLLMESYKKDRDICSGTACDNLGKDCRNTLRLLLVDKGVAGKLQQAVNTPHQAFGRLNELVADRPLISADMKTFSQLAQAYRAACNSINNKLTKELPNIQKTCSGFLSDIFPENPYKVWGERLNECNKYFSQQTSGIQYYYDFLKDLVETFNEFRNLLFGGETTWCCPRTDEFPKHLLLGNLVPGTKPDENRTPFYPSPVTSRTMEQVNHASFLIRKLDALIMTFQLPVSTGTPVRITPSLSEEQPLEGRAIPCYYQVDKSGTLPAIHQNWNYRLHTRGMDAYNYSYHASEYDAQGAAAAPLTSQIGCFSFFRIEGHLGQTVSTAESTIESEIKNRNLPFTVRSVMIGADRTKLVKKPGVRYTDLHRMHYLLRQDLFHQLKEVESFSAAFKSKVDSADTSVKDSLETSGGATVSYIAAEKNEKVMANAQKAMTKVNMSYSQVKANPTWKDDVREVLLATGEFKANLGKVVKTEFTTPFDSIIGNTHLQWLDWLDDMIKERDDKEDDKLLFSNFLEQHPGMEHFAGVSRGGTFVLVYDTSNQVVADFSLPYPVPEPIEAEPAEPTLTKPAIRPDFILKDGIKVQPSIKLVLDDITMTTIPNLIKTKLDDFKEINIKPLGDNLNQIKTQFDTQQTKYFTLVSDALTATRTPVASVEKTTPVYADAQLGNMVAAIREQQATVEQLEKQRSQSGLSPDEVANLDSQIEAAEMRLANTSSKTIDYVNSSGMDVSLGSQGMTALMEVNRGINAITDTKALAVVDKTLSEVQTVAANAGLRVVAGSMRRR